MASRVWISEYASLGSVAPGGQGQIAALPSIVNQATFDITGGVQSSAAFRADTKFIRVICEVQCAIKAGATATTADILIPALSPEYFGVSGGSFLSVIAAP
jgi:hypothetical protein